MTTTPEEQLEAVAITVRDHCVSPQHGLDRVKLSNQHGPLGSFDRADGVLLAKLWNDHFAALTSTWTVADEREANAKLAEEWADNASDASQDYDDGSGPSGFRMACSSIAAAIRARPLPEQTEEMSRE